MEFAKIEAVSLDDDGLAAKMVLKTRVANSDSAVAVADFSGTWCKLVRKTKLVRSCRRNYPLQQTEDVSLPRLEVLQPYSVARSTNAEACDDGDGLTVFSNW